MFSCVLCLPINAISSTDSKPVNEFPRRGCKLSYFILALTYLHKDFLPKSVNKIKLGIRAEFHLRQYEILILFECARYRIRELLYRGIPQRESSYRSRVETWNWLSFRSRQNWYEASTRTFCTYTVAVVIWLMQNSKTRSFKTVPEERLTMLKSLLLAQSKKKISQCIRRKWTKAGTQNNRLWSS